MKRKALEFLVDTAQAALVADIMRNLAGDALARLTLAPIDGTPRYRITAILEESALPALMRAVMNELDKTG